MNDIVSATARLGYKLAMAGVNKKSIMSRYIHTCQMLLRERPKNLKGKSYSSQIWLTRYLKDPYVEMARQENYRCRSAFKLLEMNEKYSILSPGQTVVDCGAAPGSWTQVATKLTNSQGKDDGPKGTVFAIDRLPIHPIEGATVLGSMDFTTAKTQSAILNLLNNNKVDVVLSDMAPNATGVRDMDHDNIIMLAYAAMKFALQVTDIGGSFVVKVWDGGKSPQLEKDLLRFYDKVKSIRPNATRDESREKFIFAKGFKGVKTASAVAA